MFCHGVTTRPNSKWMQWEKKPWLNKMSHRYKINSRVTVDQWEVGLIPNSQQEHYPHGFDCH